MASCGIDFGTSNSAVALGDGRVLVIDRAGLVPELYRSVLFFPEDSRDNLTGEAAIAEYLQGEGGRFIQSVKGWLASRSFHATQVRNRSYRLEDLVAILLRRIREAAENAVGASFEEVTLGRPAVFSIDPDEDALAERRLRDAAALAGFRSVTLMIEPIAAALTYEAGLSTEEVVLVADFGAGTSDLTLMRLGPGRRDRPDRGPDVIASGGVPIGGDRFDAEIMRHKMLSHFGSKSTYEIDGKRMPMPSHIVHKLLSWHEMSFIRERATQQLLERMLHDSDQIPAIEALQDLVMENLGFHLYRAIEAAKVALSSSDETTIVFDHARIQIRERVTRAEFEQFTSGLMEKLACCIDGLLAKAGVRAQEIDAVFLTGGSSQIPQVRALFVEGFGETRIRTGDAFTSVAEGLGRSIVS